MKRCILIICVVTSLIPRLIAQHEVGIHFSRTFFLGDISGYNKTSLPIVRNMQFETWNFSYGIYHRMYFNHYVNMKTSFNYGQLAGDDQLVDPGEYESKSWQKNYRNLHFKSSIIEFTLAMDVNLLGFQPASKSYRFTPYITSGVGLLYYNPKAEYQGQWIELQPLGTEGQGIDNTTINGKYNKLTLQFPIGIGMKYNLTQSISAGFEVAYKLTLSDYIDDVSKKYVSFDEFNSYYLTEDAERIYALSNRSVEMDPDGISSSYTEPGENRGNQDNKDKYLFIGFNISVNLDAFNSVRCPDW